MYVEFVDYAREGQLYCFFWGKQHTNLYFLVFLVLGGQFDTGFRPSVVDD